MIYAVRYSFPEMLMQLATIFEIVCTTIFVFPYLVAMFCTN